MRRVFVIENPVASRYSPDGLPQARESLQRAGWEVESARTESSQDATMLARQAASQGFDVVAAYGGDGTVMQAVAGLRGREAVLGILPGGAGNLLASNLGIPRAPRKAAEVIASGSPRPIDLLQVRTDGIERFVAVGAGTGFDADMMAATTSAQKRRWGVGAYVGFVVRTAPFMRPRPVTITLDGQTSQHEATSVIVANCPMILPPLLKLGSEVALDDGALDVIVLRARGLFTTALAVWNLLWSRETPRVRRLRGREVRVETSPPQQVQADGELCGRTPLTATVIHHGLTVMTPAHR